MSTAEPTPFWLIWNESGQAPRFKHTTALSAEREALRLASVYPGSTFVVLEPTFSARSQAMDIQRFTSDDDMVPF